LHGRRDEARSFAQNAREKVQREFSIGAMTDRWLALLPEEGDASVEWPQAIKVQPILGVANAWRFSPIARLARRLLVRVLR